MVEKNLFQIVSKAHAELGVTINGSGSLTFNTYVVNLVSFLTFRVAPIAGTIMFGVAAYLYFFSGGDESKVTKAKEIALGVITGYVLLLCSGMILNFLFAD